MKKFTEKNSKPSPGFTVGVVLKRAPVKGKIGMEIEVEGNKFPMPDGAHGTHAPCKMPGMKYWSYVHDGSLRGEANAEYVLTNPIEFEEVSASLTELFAKLTAYGSKIDESNRTSTHIHLNCQDFHFNRLASYVALYLCFEEILTEWCGEHRVGNLFCLRGIDAPATIRFFKNFIQRDGNWKFSDGLHYAGLNVGALHKYGSLEIRTLRGANDQKTILDWVEMNQRLYELSAEFPDPRDIPALFSAQGPSDFFYSVIGPKAQMLKDTINWPIEKIADSMLNGMRLAQELCYCRDWSLMKTIDLKTDPFGRDSTKIMKSLLKAGAESDGGMYAGPMDEPEGGILNQAQQQYLNAATATPLVFDEYESEPDYYDGD